MVDRLDGVALGEVGCMLRDCEWHEVKKAWMMETEGSSKLRIVKNLMEAWCRAWRVQVTTKKLR